MPQTGWTRPSVHSTSLGPLPSGGLAAGSPGVPVSAGHTRHPGRTLGYVPALWHENPSRGLCQLDNTILAGPQGPRLSSPTGPGNRCPGDIRAQQYPHKIQQQVDTVCSSPVHPAPGSLLPLPVTSVPSLETSNTDDRTGAWLEITAPRLLLCDLGHDALHLCATSPSSIKPGQGRQLPLHCMQETQVQLPQDRRGAQDRPSELGYCLRSISAAPQISKNGVHGVVGGLKLVRRLSWQPWAPHQGSLTKGFLLFSTPLSLPRTYPRHSGGGAPVPWPP